MSEQSSNQLPQQDQEPPRPMFDRIMDSRAMQVLTAAGLAVVVAGGVKYGKDVYSAEQRLDGPGEEVTQKYEKVLDAIEEEQRLRHLSGEGTVTDPFIIAVGAGQEKSKVPKGVDAREVTPAIILPNLDAIEPETKRFIESVTIPATTKEIKKVTDGSVVHKLMKGQVVRLKTDTVLPDGRTVAKTEEDKERHLDLEQAVREAAYEALPSSSEAVNSAVREAVQAESEYFDIPSDPPGTLFPEHADGKKVSLGHDIADRKQQIQEQIESYYDLHSRPSSVVDNSASK